MTVDIKDEELESLMAELEAQNQVLFEADESAKVEPAAVVEPEPEPKKVEENEYWKEKVEVEQPKAPANYVSDDDTPFDEDELAALEGLDAIEDGAMKPTKADKLNADQQVSVEVVFEPSTEVETKIQESAPQAIAPAEELAVDPVSEVVVEELPEIEAKAMPAVETSEIEEIKAVPRAQAPKLTPKAAKEAATLKFKPNLDEFLRETKVTEATLDACMYDQAGLMAYYVARHAETEAQLSRIKQQFNTLEARLYDAYRKKFLKEGEKVTEKAIENAVRMDQQWVDKSLELIEAQTYADIHKGFVSSLHDRRGMLMQIGADRREEMKGSLRIRENFDPNGHAAQSARSSSDDLAARAMASARAALNKS